MLNVETESMSSRPENILGTEKIGKLLAKFAIPGIVAMVVNALYNIIDQIFIGQGVGFLGNAATTVVFPMTTFAMAFAMLFGDGAASRLSLMLGRGEKEKAASGAAAGIVGVIGSGIIIAVLYLIFMEPLLTLFGATENSLPYATDYGTIITLGIPFCAICSGVSSLIRADGSPKFNMIGLLTGCVLNLTLDPIFIFVFHMGVKGAAWATIIGQFANACLNIFYIVKKMKSVKLNKKAWQSAMGSLGYVALLGVSSFINQLALVIAMAVRNNVLVIYGEKSIYGKDIPVAALGVTMKVFSIIMCMVLGLCTGAQPILGYNYGAKKYDRVKGTYKLIVLISTIIGLVAFAIAQLKPMAIISIFGAEDALYNEFAVMCMRKYLMLIPLFGFNIASGVFFQALGYPAQSSILSLSKQIIFQLPVTIGLPMIFGIVGVLYAGPVSDFLSFALTLILILTHWKKMFSNGDNKLGGI